MLGLAPVYRLVRKRDLDPLGIEGLLDPPIHFSADPPLFDGLSLDPALDDDGRVGKLVDPEHFEGGQNVVGKLRILTQVCRDLLQDRHDFVHVLPIGDADIEHINRSNPLSCSSLYR